MLHCESGLLAVDLRGGVLPCREQLVFSEPRFALGTFAADMRLNQSIGLQNLPASFLKRERWVVGWGCFRFFKRTILM